MTGFLIGFLSTALVGIFSSYLIDRPHRLKHKARMADLDECSRHANEAAKHIGKSDGLYEYHMRQAVYFFDHSYEEGRKA